MLILVEEKILWLSIPKSIWIQSAYSIKQIGTIQMWWNGKVINYSSEWATISKISPFITIIDSSSTQPLKFILQQLSWKILFLKRIVKLKWMKSINFFFEYKYSYFIISQWRSKYGQKCYATWMRSEMDWNEKGCPSIFMGEIINLYINFVNAIKFFIQWDMMLKDWVWSWMEAKNWDERSHFSISQSFQHISTKLSDHPIDYLDSHFWVIIVLSSSILYI